MLSCLVKHDDSELSIVVLSVVPVTILSLPEDVLRHTSIDCYSSDNSVFTPEIV